MLNYENVPYERDIINVNSNNKCNITFVNIWSLFIFGHFCTCVVTTNKIINVYFNYCTIVITKTRNIYASSERILVKLISGKL